MNRQPTKAELKKMNPFRRQYLEDIGIIKTLRTESNDPMLQENPGDSCNVYRNVSKDLPVDSNLVDDEYCPF